MPHPDSRPTPGQTRADQAEKLRHFRHLLDDEHFAFYGEQVSAIVQREREAALDETKGPKERRRHLARYHMARELSELVPAYEKALRSVLETRPVR